MLSKKLCTTFSDRESFAIFVKAAILKPFLGYIPDPKKKDEFVCYIDYNTTFSISISVTNLFVYLLYGQLLPFLLALVPTA
jgi:hypothetical protein